MRISLLFSVCMKALAISRIDSARFSRASTTPVRKILPVNIVGNEPSDSAQPPYVRCLLPSVTFLALMSQFLFSVMNINDGRAFLLTSIVIEDFIMGL